MTADSEVRTLVVDLATRARSAARTIAAAPTDKKNAVLRRAAEGLRSASLPRILAANEEDLASARESGLGAAMLDRLTLSPTRLQDVANGVDEIADLPDPVGEIFGARTLANGLAIARMRIPIGVIGMIYESRPNVTADAAALCIKSGNAVLLRGGKEAFHSNRAIADVFALALEAEGLDPMTACLLPTTNREATLEMLHLDGILDLVIPRGGEDLIRFVVDNSRLPVIQHYKGVCHVYVDGDADLKMARSIVMNAKTQRPGVCNALETLLVDRACAEAFIPKMMAELGAAGVEVRGDEVVCRLSSDAVPAAPTDWDAEYLDLVLSVAVVDGLDGALDHIARHGSHHTEAIVTENAARAARFQREVDASLVLINASTRFNDGYQLGLGAEIGISTTKLHAYGPMGLSELCAVKWIATGQGQVRE